MSYVRHLECVSCHKTYPRSEFRYFCDECKGFLDVVLDLDRMKQELKRGDFSCRPPSIMERWLEFLPIEKPELIPDVTLGESVTPLIHCRRLGEYLGLKRLYVKDETRFPTGTLKDRSMPLVVLKALEFGYKSVSIVSSGNAAASLAAYAAKAGLQAVVFVAGGKSARILKTQSYGPVLIHVEAPYSDVENLFLEAREAYGWYDCNGLINPFRLEGKKTVAHEVSQSLGWTVPDAVLMPTAFGNGLVSAWRGFLELEELGWTSGRPAMYCVQPDNCAPIARAYERGDTTVAAVKPLPTAATSIAVGDPAIGGRRVLDVVRKSNGAAVGVSEEMLSCAQRLLAQKEGIFNEPAGVSAVAAVIKLVDEGKLAKDACIVCTITGEGLNQAESIEPWAEPAHKVPADLNALRAVLDKVVR